MTRVARGNLLALSLAAAVTVAAQAADESSPGNGSLQRKCGSPARSSLRPRVRQRAAMRR